MWEESPYVHLGVEGHFFCRGQSSDPRHSLCSQSADNRHSDCNSRPQASPAAVASWAQCLLLYGNHPKPQNKQNHIAFNSWKSVMNKQK